MSFFDHMFSDFGGAIPGGGAPHIAVSEWVRRFVLVAGPKLAARLIACDPCEYTGCGTRAFAASRCVRCKKMMCIDHCLLHHTGDGICLGCAQVYPVNPHAPPDVPPAGPSPARPAVDPALEAKFQAAVASLGLTPQATRDEVQKRVKELRFQFHPDRAAPELREQYTRQLVLIGQALKIIHDYRGWT